MAAQDDPPNDYRDPYWTALADTTGQRLGLPVGLLPAIVTRGERSNNDAVSSAGARTPFQVTPSTRKLALDKFGVDAYLSPQNAAEVAGLLLKDSLARNDGDPKAAIGEYVGGTDRSNWGPVTKAYVGRVSGAQEASKASALDNDFAKWMQSNPAAPAAPAAPPAAGGDPLADGFGKWMATTGTPNVDVPGMYNGTPPVAPPKPQVPLTDKLVGAGEAGLLAATGGVGGALGMLGGGAVGLVQNVRQLARGEVGPDNMAALSQAGAQALTYQPRTPVGQQYGDVVLDGAQNLTPVMGLMGELGAMGALAGPASAQAGAAVRAAPGAVADAVQSARGAAPAAAAVADAAPLVAEIATTARSAADGSKSATQALAEQAAPNPTIVKSAERLGIADLLQPDHVTTNDAFRQLSGAVKSNPMAKTALAEASSLPEVAKRASDLIDEIGGSNDVSSLSASLKQRMQATRDELSDAEGALYDKLRTQVPAQTDAPAPNVLAFIQQRAEDLGGDHNLTPLEKSIAAKLTPVGESLDHLGPKAREQLAAQGITGQTQPTYALLDDVRKDVGSAAKMRGPYADADTGLAKKLYAELSKDQEAVALKAGAGDTFDLARKTSALRFGMQDDLASLFGKDISGSLASGGDGGLPGAVRALAVGDSARIVRLMQAVPQDMRQAVTATGLGTVFRKAGTRGEMDFTGYAKWMDGLRRNRQAYAALMSNLPLDARKQLTALYRVSKGISDSMQTRTKTGLLGPIREQMMQPDSLMTNLYSLAKRSAVGAVVEPLTSAVGLHGAGITAALSSALTRGKVKAFAAVDNLLASSEFLHLAKTPVGSPARAAATRTLAVSPAFGKVLRSARIPMTLSERERWIAQAMQSNPDTDRHRAVLRLPAPTVH